MLCLERFEERMASVFEIEWLSGENKGEKAALKAGPNVLGRSRRADIVLKDRSLSMTHCSVIVSDDSLEIEDSESLAGTVVSGQKIEGRVPLEAGAEVVIGETRFRVAQPGASSPPRRKSRFRKRTEARPAAEDSAAARGRTRRSKRLAELKAEKASLEADEPTRRPRRTTRSRPSGEEAPASRRKSRIRSTLERLKQARDTSETSDTALSEKRRALRAKRMQRDAEEARTLKRQIEQVNQKVHELERVIRDKERELRAAQTETRALKAAQRKGDVELRRKQDELDNLESRLAQVREELDSVRSDAEEKQDRADRAGDDIHAVRTSAEIRLKEREQQLRAEMAANAQKVAEFDSRIEEMEQDYVVQHDTIEKLEAELESVRAALQNSERELKDAEQRCRGLEEEIDTVDEQVESLVAEKLARHESEAAALADTQRELDELIASYEQRIEELGQRIEELEEVNAALKASP